MKKFEVNWVSEDAQGVIYSEKEIVKAMDKTEAERMVRLIPKNGINRYPIGVKEIFE